MFLSYALHLRSGFTKTVWTYSLKDCKVIIQIFLNNEIYRYLFVSRELSQGNF